MQAYIFPVHQCSVCTFLEAILCHEAFLQSSAHSLVGNSQDTNFLLDRRMALGHTRSNLSQRWLLALGFCTSVSYHKVQSLVSCMHKNEKK